jgi:hypothetical protein
MNDLELKINFYKNKIDKILIKMTTLKENIKSNKIKILQFILTIDDMEFQEIILNKLNYDMKTYENIESIYTSDINDKEYYDLIKNKYKTLKYNKNVLQENLFLYWSDTFNYKEKINFILKLSPI